MSIKAQDAIRVARALLGTPYSELDCINLIKRVIRTAPGGVPGYTTAGTNTLWNSYNSAAKYRDLTWRKEGVAVAKAGMLAFKCSGENVHHVGLVTGEGTVIHSSSARGMVVETKLDKSWDLLAIHRYIETLPQPAAPAAPSGGSLTGDDDGKGGTSVEAYKMRVRLQDEDSTLNVRNEPGRAGDRIGRLHHGAVVTVQAEMENGWKYISYGDSGSGYVDGSFLVPYEELDPEKPDALAVTIIDSAGNRFVPVGDFRVLIGSID